MFSVALMASLACAFGLAQNANAGVSVDVLFQDATIPSGITILPGEAGTGCAFGGYAGGSVGSGYCMDVILSSTYDMIVLGSSVTYDSDNGLAVGTIYEWKGPIVGWNRGNPSQWCSPPAGVTDNGSTLQSFDCLVAPPNNPPVVAAGTYTIGTIIWNTSATTPGTETIAAWINDLVDAVGAVINGTPVALGSADIVVGTHILTIVPEPGTASLLGLGLVGLILAGRRSRA
jgi:hypothetical protein